MQSKINPFAAYEPFVFALTNSRTLGRLAHEANSTQDIIEIIQGVSPMIDKSVKRSMARELLAKRKQQERGSNNGLRSK